MTIVNWLTATSLPRIWAGAISAIYIGERLDARPMATPPQIRQAMKTWNWLAAPVPIEETAKITAAAISSFFRPNRSLSTPDPRRRTSSRSRRNSSPNLGASPTLG